MLSRAPWRDSKDAIRALSACTIGSGNESASPLILIRIAAFRSIRWAFSDTTRSWTCEAGATDSKHVGDVGGAAQSIRNLRRDCDIAGRILGAIWPTRRPTAFP